jgi:UDP-N-acetylmuramoyl-tripeptide--D-alanyl-D-alanine ligase
MSAPFRAADAQRWMGARLVQGSPEAVLVGASLDSRAVAAGEIFVAIVGPRHDAHAFLADAAARGAGALVVQTGRALPAALAAAIPILEVRDTTLALGQLGAGHRADFRGPVIAITGSNGKTTTKEMTAAALAALGPCLKTEGNLNNNFGVPLTLLRRAREHVALIVEIGMNHRGEIRPLTEIARPTVAVITNAGTAHIEHLGSRDAIAEEKGDILLGLSRDGVAVLNADDERVLAQARRAPGRVLRFGRAPTAEVCAESARARGGRYEIECATPAGRVRLEVAGLGESTVANALAACAAALAAGASLDAIGSGLRAYRPPHGRLEPIALANDITLVDDSYNANPQSMANALRALAALRASSGGRGRAIAILGAMGELGPHAEHSHRELGALAAELALDALVVVGDPGAWIAAGASAAGFGAQKLFVCASCEEAATAASSWLRAGDFALVKGSRSARMERVVESLVAEKRD